MILTKNNPSNKTLDSVFNEFFNAFPSNWNVENKNASVPVNITENEKGFTIFLNAPGRNKENFSISVENNLLTIEYKKPEEMEGEKEKLVRREFFLGNFKRTFSVDEKVTIEGIEAKYDNGILKVFIPRKEEVKISTKQIMVQ